MNRAPRVTHLVPALFGGEGIIGGAERYAYELARHMAHVTPTRLVTFGNTDSSCSVDGLDVRVIGNPHYVRGQESNPISRELLAELRRAEIVHCHQHHIVASSVAALFCRMTGRRVFVTDLGGGGWDVSAYISTDRWYHGHLHLSEYSRKIAGHAENPAAKVILGGVDTDKFRPDESVTRKPTVLFVGRLLPHKGVDDLIDAMAPELELELIGQPYDANFLSALTSRASGRRVTFRHDCGDRELIKAYQRALCVVLPSVYRTMYGQESMVPELLGQTLLEGMACGTPVICTKVAAMPEVVRDGITGFVVPPNDPAALGERIRWLVEHPSEAARMGRAAREWVLEKFTWPQVVHRCLDAYGACA
jgi:glycosyltransferase involved in cell wall biosynthesis